MTTYSPCIKGSYCPGGDIYPVPCPAGTYNSPDGSDDVGDCLECPSTQYCETAGQLSTTDKCAEGFVCLTGNDRPGPYIEIFNGTVSGRCPSGAYCDAGATDFVACSAGTYQDTTQNGECERCPPGYFCTGAAATKIECDSGYYCSVDSSVPAPPVDSAYGDICPIDYYCPDGTSQPFRCKDGQRNLYIGQSEC